MTTTEIAFQCKKIFEPYIAVQNDDIQALFERGEILTFEKNKILKKQNCKEEYLRFIIDGIGGYFVNYNNKSTGFYF